MTGFLPQVVAVLSLAGTFAGLALAAVGWYSIIFANIPSGLIGTSVLAIAASSGLWLYLIEEWWVTPLLHIGALLSCIDHRLRRKSPPAS